MRSNHSSRDNSIHYYFDIDMTFQSPTSVRSYASIFAIVLGLQAAWLITAELARPKLPFFPINGTEAQAAATHQSAAAIAAGIGWPRGSLWVDYAITANAAVAGNMEDGSIPNAPGANDKPYKTAETAAALTPADARAWVLLAMITAQTDSKDSIALAQLKMSYYTSPYNDALFPLRIQIAARSPSIADDELQSFVEYELGMVVRHRPTLKRSIATAFRAASPAGRHFLESALAKLDPKLLAELRAATP